MSEEHYTPWPSEPPPAKLWWPEDRPEIGNLKFRDPNGDIAIIPVTHGPDHERRTTDGSVGSPIWHIEVDGDVATVSPSIHWVGYWHSPNPVLFRLVDELQ